MELIIARHGESFGNIVNYDCPDPELTPTGVRQAELLAKRLADENFDIVLLQSLGPIPWKQLGSYVKKKRKTSRLYQFTGGSRLTLSYRFNRK